MVSIAAVVYVWVAVVAASVGVRMVAACETLPATSACSTLLNYNSVYVSAAAGCTSALEANNITPFGNTLSVLSATCREATARLLCTATYRTCTAPQLAPCATLCDNVRNDAVCSATERSLIASAGLNVTSACSTGTSSGVDCNADVSSTAVAVHPKCDAAYTGSICAGVIPTTGRGVWVPSTVASQAVLEAALAVNAWTFRIAPKANGCREMWAEYVCTGTFLGCESGVLGRAVGSPVQLPFPRLPCRSLCNTLYSVCPASFLATVGVHVDCTASTPSTCGNDTVSPAGGYRSFPQFPVSTSTWGVISGQPLTTECQGWASQTVANPNVTISSLTCPFPLVVPDDPEFETLGGGTCALPCPSPLFTQDEWSSLATLSWVLLSLSVLGSGFCALTWFCFKRTQETLTALLISCFFYSVFYLAAVSNRGSIGESACRDNSQLQKQGDSDAGGCVFIAVWTYYFGMACVMWWFCLMWDAFDQVVIDPANSRARWPTKRKIFHIWSWTVPAIFVIAILAGDNFGTEVGATCQPIGDYSKAYWYFLLSIVVIGVAQLFWICIKLYRDASQTKQLKRYWAHNKRLLAFLFAWFWMLIIESMCRIYFDTHRHSFDDSTRDWIRCLLQYDDTGRCGEAPEPRFSIFIFFLNTFVTAGLGTVISIVYGTMENNFLYWRDTICGAPPKDGANRTSGEESDITDRYRDHSASLSSKKTPSASAGMSVGGVSYAPGASMAGGMSGAGGNSIQLSGNSIGHSVSRPGAVVATSSGSAVPAAAAANPHSREPKRMDLAVAMPHLSLTSAERGSQVDAEAAAAAAAAAPKSGEHPSAAAARDAASSTASNPPAAADGAAAPTLNRDNSTSGNAANAVMRSASGNAITRSASGSITMDINTEKLAYFFDK